MGMVMLERMMRQRYCCHVHVHYESQKMPVDDE
jgi:hypothetical protein